MRLRSRRKYLPRFPLGKFRLASHRHCVNRSNLLLTGAFFWLVQRACSRELAPPDRGSWSNRASTFADKSKQSFSFKLSDDPIVHQIFGFETGEFFIGEGQHPDAVADTFYVGIHPPRVHFAHTFVDIPTIV